MAPNPCACECTEILEAFPNPGVRLRYVGLLLINHLEKDPTVGWLLALHGSAAHINVTPLLAAEAGNPYFVPPNLCP